MCRVEMLDEHECHSRVGRQLREELHQRFEPPGRGAHADDGKRHVWTDRRSTSSRARARVFVITPSEARSAPASRAAKGTSTAMGCVRRPESSDRDGPEGDLSSALSTFMAVESIGMTGNRRNSGRERILFPRQPR